MNSHCQQTSQHRTLRTTGAKKVQTMTDLHRTVQLNSIATVGFLGGLPEGGSKNKIPTDSFYGRLLRPSLSTLPPVHSRDTFPDVCDPALKKAFMRIYSGDFTLEWMIDHGRDVDTVFIAAIIDETDDTPSSTAMQGPLIQIMIESRRVGDDSCLGVAYGAPDGHRTFHSALRESQKEALHERLLHIFLRTNGTALNKRLFICVHEHLNGRYNTKKWYKEIVDLSIIRADVHFNKSDGSDTLLPDLVQVGEALEFIGRFREAAVLYEEIADKYVGHYPGGHDVAHLTKFAALAYSREGDFEVSERAYVKALNTDLARTSGSWATTDYRTTNLFADMVSMYLGWQKQQAFASGNPIADATLEYALGSLSCAAGIKSDYIQVYGDADCVKNKFLNPKMAQKVLKAAVSRPGDEKHFRSTLLTCNKAAGFDRTLDLNEIKSKRTKKVDARKVAALTIQNQNARFEAFARWNPECLKRHEESNTMWWCPCHTVCYHCNKSCQVAHWKEHKKVCPSRKKAVK
jgi:tetratricopeptide (TPR) repeat protein